MILLLYLAVNLEVKDGEESLLDAKEIIKPRPEFQSKNWAFIWNDSVEQAIMLDYYIVNDFC